MYYFHKARLYRLDNAYKTSRKINNESIRSYFMIIKLCHNNQDYRIDTKESIDISIPYNFNSLQPTYDIILHL